MIRSLVAGVGAYLPARVVDNDALASRLDTSDAWIRERTGITRRHIAADDELTSDLAVEAARRALERAGAKPAAVEAIVLATSTPDHTFPATATAVQRKLGAPIGIALDVQAVCAGFAYGLAVADSLLRLGHARTALVIGAETFSRLLDWNDRSTAVLFGDGAGALLLRADRQGGTLADRGLLATKLAADGRHYGDLWVDGGPSATRSTGHLRMNGREVFRHAVARLAESVLAVLGETGLSVDDLDLLVPHQANLRIIEAVAKRLGVPAEKTVVTVDRHANTSAASIPLALDVAANDGRLVAGRLVAVNALGGGFAWGATLLRW
ncbi:MAG: ketoacyl-ACP synthase III [Geminicoccaceae bacterium]|nr:ketoacyl-ACP synthase III [Geminicoccaceae bacterium]